MSAFKSHQIPTNKDVIIKPGTHAINEAIHIESNQKGAITFKANVDDEYLKNKINFDNNHHNLNDVQHYQFDETDIGNRKQLNHFVSQFNKKDQTMSDLHSIDMISASNIYRSMLNDNEKCNLSKCPCFDRISTILKKYNLLIRTANDDNANNDVDGNSIDNIYFNENYKDRNLLNDYNHLLFVHSTEFEEIHNILMVKCNDHKTCDLSKCKILKRNQRERSRFSANYHLLKELYFSTDGNNDDDVIIRQQLIDRIHCHYFHSFDLGLKIKKNVLNDIINHNDDDDDDDDDDDEEMKGNHFDSNVYKINKWITWKRNEFKNVEGLRRLKNQKNKFIFQPKEIQKKEEKKEEKLKEKKEEKKESTGNEQYCYGQRYFYWDYYKENDDEIDDAHFAAQHGSAQFAANPGFRVRDWYISPKYNNFKEELLMNEISVIGGEQWSNLMMKAIKFIDTDHVREIAICPRTVTAKCYDLKQNELNLIKKNHLIAIMVYCNYDVLQYEFTKTFRYKNKYETDQEMIARHRNYYFLGRLLRECVECFGIKRKKISEHFTLWYGLNKHFTFLSIYAFIKGPLSTSTDYAVAANFCDNKGTILNININTMHFMYEANMKHKEGMFRRSMFDCHWLSDYSNEQEIFFIGGLNVFHFDTIIHAPMGQNYVKYVKGLKQMTIGMETGSGISSSDISPAKTVEEKQTVFRLLSDELNRYYPNNPNSHQFKSCPTYFKTILHEHCKHIKLIGFSKYKKYQCLINELLFKYDYGWIKVDLLNTLFPNLEVLQFDADDKDISFLKRSSIYHSILSLLKTRKNTNLKSIQIEINPNYESEISDYIQFYKKDFEKHSWKIQTIITPKYEGMGMDKDEKQATIYMIDMYSKYYPNNTLAI